MTKHHPLVFQFASRKAGAAAIAFVTGLLAGSAAIAQVDERGDNLAKLGLQGVSITAVEILPAGDLALPDGKTVLANLPACCRVAALLQPSPDSTIRIEVWLPLENWNRRLLGTGNGGSAGRINPGALAMGLKRGFATANTDLGTSPNAEAAIGHPEKWADFGYRATHEMTVVAKKIVAAFYGEPANRAYFIGGSTGGQQAIMEAERFPEDYDGILAGVPANNRTHLHHLFLWNWRALNEVPGRSNLSPAQIALVTRTVIEQCGGKDGGAPGDAFLTDPRLSRFDPATLLAPPGVPPGDRYLSLEQVNALKKVYAGPTNPRTGEQIYTPIPFGSENSALGLEHQQDTAKLPGSLLYPWRWVFGADYDYSRYDFDHDLDTLDAQLAPVLNANRADLTAFDQRGGKLIMHAGTADPLVPFQDAINYYERVVAREGGLVRTQGFFRLFVVPGLGHGKSPGLGEFGSGQNVSTPQDAERDVLSALMRWVEQGVPPARVIATASEEVNHVRSIRLERPVFPYPLFPHYIGGDTKLASSFQGVEHARGRVLAPAVKYER